MIPQHLQSAPHTATDHSILHIDIYRYIIIKIMKSSNYGYIVYDRVNI